MSKPPTGEKETLKRIRDKHPSWTACPVCLRSLASPTAKGGVRQHEIEQLRGQLAAAEKRISDAIKWLEAGNGTAVIHMLKGYKPLAKIGGKP